MNAKGPPRRNLAALCRPHSLLTLTWTLLLARAYGHSPLVNPSQHPYFLHGLARAGYAFLGRIGWPATSILCRGLPRW